MARNQLFPLLWPKKGFVENSALMDQPELTTTDCLNVRNYDTLDRRNRGGQRTGIRKYITTAVNGSAAIQSIGSVVLAFDSSTIIADTALLEQDYTDTTTWPDNPLPTNDSNWVAYTANFAALATGNDVLENNTGQLQTQVAGVALQAGYYNVDLSPGAKYVVRWRGQTKPAGIPHQIFVRLHSSAPGTNDYVYVQVSENGAGVLTATLRTFTAPSTHANVALTTGSTDVSSLATGTIDEYQDYELHVNGNNFRLLVNDSEAWTATTTKASSQTYFGLQTGEGSGTHASFENFNIFTGLTPISLRTTKLVTVSGGDIYVGNKDDGLAVPTGGTNAQVTSGVTAMQDAFQKMYFCDGNSADYKVYNAATNTISDWQDSLTAGALPIGGTGTRYNITAVTPATPSFTVAEDLSSILSAGDFIELRDALTVDEDSDGTLKNNNGTYTVASTSGTGPTVITVNQTIPTTSVSGSISEADVACRIMALYRGRLVLSGLETDPQNWFMSASQDVNNWDYFPTILNQQQAVAGNTSQTAGKLGDVVTALAPYTDDVMIIGMANSISVMRSDPAAGGAIDAVSSKVGIAGPQAWTFDTAQTFYFFWINGLYKMDLNTFQPILLSQNRLDKTFSDINIADKRIILEYDPEWQGVHVFVTDDTQPTTAPIHYFWDERNDAWWRDQYPANIGPTFVWRLNADDPEDNATLLGGFDSFLREFSDSVTDDDGTVITSFCRFTPLVTGDVIASSRIDDVHVILDSNSDPVNLRCFSGDTVETAEANADAAILRWTKGLLGGRNTPVRRRVSDSVVIFELRQTTDADGGTTATWAYEKGMGKIAIINRMHGQNV